MCILYLHWSTKCLIGRTEILYTQEIYFYFLPEVEFYFCSIIYYLTIFIDRNQWHTYDISNNSHSWIIKKWLPMFLCIFRIKLPIQLYNYTNTQNFQLQKSVHPSNYYFVVKYLYITYVYTVKPALKGTSV
jgi:hypothetical protein